MLFILFLSLFQTRVAMAADWSAIDERFHKNHLCESYVDGSSYLIERKSCSTLGCDTWQYIQKVSCSNSEATIEFWNQDKIFARQTISADQYQGVQGNLLRLFAQSTESFGNVFSLTSVRELSSGELEVKFDISRQGKVIETGTWILGSSEEPVIPMVRTKVSASQILLKEVNTDTFLKAL